MSAECVFCKIARGEMGELLYEDDLSAAFADLNPRPLCTSWSFPKCMRKASLMWRMKTPWGASLQWPTLTARERDLNGYRVVINTGKMADRQYPSACPCFRWNNYHVTYLIFKIGTFG